MELEGVSIYGMGMSLNIWNWNESQYNKEWE